MSAVAGRTAELEAAVRTRFDAESLAVYGDYLMGQGDPRGELIAMDLGLLADAPPPKPVEERPTDWTERIARLSAAVPPPDAREARRRELLRAWIGDVRPPGRLWCGFFEVDATSADPAAQLDAAFASPAAPFIRSVAVCGTPAMLDGAVASIARAQHPWLVALQLRQWGESNQAIHSTTTRELVDATPHLAQLDVDGRRVFGPSFDHPGIRRLRVSGWDAVGRLTSDGDGTMAAVTSLDLAIHSHLASSHADPSTLALRAPALRVLDLSRNNPGHVDPDMLGGKFAIFTWLAKLDVVRRLERLVVPKPRGKAEADAWNRAIASLPATATYAVV